MNSTVETHGAIHSEVFVCNLAKAFELESDFETSIFRYALLKYS